MRKTFTDYYSVRMNNHAMADSELATPTNEVGCGMTSGNIRIKGSTGFFSGVHVNNGTIFIEGNCLRRATCNGETRSSSRDTTPAILKP